MFEYMKIKRSILQKLDNNRGHGRLMAALDCSQSTIRLYIKNRDDNLTKLAAMQVFREVTGLSDEEILEDEKVKIG